MVIRKKNRRGVARAKKIVNNDTIATGESPASIFRQQGGKKLYEGMLIESMEDIGIIGHIGYLTGGNKAISGVTLGVEYLISRPLKVQALGDLYFGIGGAFNAFKDINPGYISFNPGYNYRGTVTGTNILTTEEKEWSGITMNFWANVTKEIYLLPQGNFYLAPTIGVGFTGYSFTKYKGNLLTDYSWYDDEDNPYTWGAFMFPIKLGLGINLHPNVSLQIQPGFSIVRPYTTSLDINEDESESYSLIQSSSSSDVATDWAFDKIATGSTNFSLGILVKIRL